MADAAPALAEPTRLTDRLAARLVALRGWRRWGLSLTLGCIATLALPPVGAVPLLLLVFPAMIWILQGSANGRAALVAGWSFGFGYFLAGLYWVGFAFLVDVARFAWALPFAMSGLPAVLALFWGLAAMACHTLRPRGIAWPVAFAAILALAEWARGHLFTGFPWNLLGYGWVDWLPMLQGAALFGIYGLTLLTILAASLPAALATVHPPAQAGRGRYVAPAAVAASLVALLAVYVWGAARLDLAPTSTVPGVALRLVQPNIAQRDKWQVDLREAHLRLQMAMSTGTGADGQPATHIIWPETAIAYFPEDDQPLRDLLSQLLEPGGVLILGAPRREVGADGDRNYWNSLFAIDTQGEIRASYDKFHLVPFGEYVPLRDIMPVDAFTPGTIDYSAGPGPQTLQIPGLPPFSPLICYEAIFPGNVIDDRGGDGSPHPEWLLNLTNDAWFGQSAGPHQHFAIARTRAVEEGLPLVRVAATGISGVVDAYGRVRARLALGEQGVIDTALPTPLNGGTLYRATGDGLFLIMALGLLFAAMAWSRTCRETNP